MSINNRQSDRKLRSKGKGRCDVDTGLPSQVPCWLVDLLQLLRIWVESSLRCSFCRFVPHQTWVPSLQDTLLPPLGGSPLAGALGRPAPLGRGCLPSVFEHPAHPCGVYPGYGSSLRGPVLRPARAWVALRDKVLFPHREQVCFLKTKTSFG